jgi:Tol biopolymer transport system component
MKRNRRLLGLAILCTVIVSAGCAQDEPEWKKEAELVFGDTSWRDGEFAPAMDVDGKKIYFQRFDSDKITLFFSQKDQNGWTKPSPAEFGQPQFSEGDPFISPDGNKIFFASGRPLGDSVSNSKAPNKFHLWEAEKSGSGWSSPTPLSPVINNEETYQYWPSIAANGNLYFCINPGEEDDDIYVSKYENGKYTEPTPLFNSSEVEEAPYIAPDESYLLFSKMTSSGDFMSGNIFISYNRNGEWSEPEKLNSTVNTDEAYEGSPRITPDGRYLLFNRVDKTQHIDLYRIDLRNLNIDIQ